MSPTTVSRVVNGSDLVSTDARSRVLAAIKELNYVPDSVARGLVTNRTNAVALVIPESESRLGSEPFFAALIRGVSGALAESRTQLQLMLVRDQAERDKLTESVATRRVDGVLLVSVHSEDRLPGMLEEMGLPTVLAGRRDAGERLSYVDSDNAGGACEAVRHLLRGGGPGSPRSPGRWTWTSAAAGSPAGVTSTGRQECPRVSSWPRRVTSPRRAAPAQCVRFLNAPRTWTPCSPPPT
ncbi:HTH-type transcriptional repressor PurR [Streptomyces hirsutus]